ncbi:MAG: 3-deoxy-manno-octulosonate cytidylyltransferase [Pseudomonadales bacterium]|nr:3-deoxy-manno-octulosonate cytidylyltransferase [Pseudomonadales bacterium]MDP7145154.1 3-deoxy-manno-octulosonate cytidylyltransferase [Pseudomonadales bacterium]MDP7358468.1 3-deoxy-manno-octulosonate cytidylyltransferase [Pseudomonadales bacterium]MDP7594911.1 3-deoxy-manno-octulosonate cytidylyltransferase [Pseudomonadales bacterium]HJN49144.1 3-deoxy-manno-octulosonate cytidylyltransferase [Pseudomonadales bacterium]
MAFNVIIPARFQSQRLPGKPLIDIAGKPMIQHVYERSCCSDADRVIVATDSAEVQAAVESFGGDVYMTSEDHPSGTDRLQEVTSREGYDDEQIVVNVQGDEPLIPAEAINQVASNLAASTAEIATLCEPIDRIDDLFDPNIVKVITDHGGHAIYFSRAPIPWCRDSFSGAQKKLSSIFVHQRHLGIYAYRVKVLNDFVTWQPSPLEVTERLEQLRAMWHGARIHVAQAVVAIPPGVDTEKDLERVRRILVDA